VDIELLDLTTELDAVNAMLASVGESPVSSISGDFVDASVAQQLLTQESRRTQLHGWTFNTDLGRILSPDNDGIIYIDKNVLKFITQDTNIVHRKDRLYDRSTQSDVFTSTVTADLVVFLPWDFLPEALRTFIYMRASRRFQNRLNGVAEDARFMTADEKSAWAGLLNAEAEVAQYNALTSNLLTQRMKGGRS